jgi:hypothetical protein
MINNEFTINEVQCIIHNVIPKTIISEYNGKQDFVKEIYAHLYFPYKDITWTTDDDPGYNEQTGLTIDITNVNFSNGEYLNISEIEKVMFYDIIKAEAEKSENIQRIVSHIRIRTGKDKSTGQKIAESPNNISRRKKMIEFK